MGMFRRKISLVLVILLAVLGFVHRWGLSNLAQGLVVSEQISLQDHVLLWGWADSCFDIAAQLFRENPARRVLMVERQPDRLQQLGILETDEYLFHKELSARDVPSSSQEMIPGKAQDSRAGCAQLLLWLKNHPDETIVVLCDEFQSRRMSLQLSRRLGSEAARVTVHGLADRRFGTNNWWTTRRGIRAFTLSWIRLFETWQRGGSTETPDCSWDPDDYEQELQEWAANPQLISARPQPTSWLGALGNWLDVGETPSIVDHVLVLPGDQNTRPFAAAAFINAHLARDVLIPQNFPSPQQQDGIGIPTHEVTRKVLLARGVSGEQIVILSGCSDKTIDDARVAATLLKSDAESHVAVITNFYHTRRTRLAFRHVFGRDIHRFAFISVPAEKFNSANWWKTEEGTFTIVSEFAKLGLYWFQYDDGFYWGWCGFAGFAALAILRRRSRRLLRLRKMVEI